MVILRRFSGGIDEVSIMRLYRVNSVDTDHAMAYLLISFQKQAAWDTRLKRLLISYFIFLIREKSYPKLAALLLTKPAS